MKDRTNTFSIVLTIIATAALLFTAAALLNTSSSTTGAPDDYVTYIDTDGTEKYSDEIAVEIDAAYLASVSYTLGDGWYYVTSTFSLGSNILYISGDTHIILADSITMTAGVTVTSGNSLSVYAQSDGTDIGRLSRSGTTITLQDDTSLTNTAYITGTTGVSAGTGTEVQITNGITGTIRGSSATGISVVKSTIVNYGQIESGGSMNPGIYSSGYTELFNGETGTIKTVSWGVRFMGGGHIDNSGTILSTGNVTATAVESAGYMTIINREGAVIQGGGDCGIILGLGGVVENAGTITCTSGSGLYIRPGANSGIDQNRDPLPVTVINYETGSIYNFYNYRDDLSVTLEAGSTITGTFRMGSGDSVITFSGDPGVSLTYTTVGGATTFGSGIVGVGIDIAGLPPTISVGDVLVLVDSGGAFSGYPKNSTFSDSGYSFDISVVNDQLIATVTAVPPDPTYEITLTPSAYTFPAETVNYSAQSPKTMTVTNTGTGDVFDLEVVITGNDASAFTISVISIASIPAGGDSVFTIVPNTGLAAGTYTVTVTVSSAQVSNTPVNSVSSAVSFTVKSPAPGNNGYKISSISDSGSTISPKGITTVPSGSNKTFTFSAAAGYTITEVIVDGTPLTQGQVDSGHYTFSQISADHTIVVKSVADPAIILTITVAAGEGYAEFSVDSGDFQQYVSEVTLADHTDLTIRAVAGDGYRFTEWRAGTDVFKSSETSFTDVRSSLSLELYFEKDGSSAGGGDGPGLWWFVGIILLLLLAGMLIWFIFFYRRYYDVIKVGRADAIIGRDTVHRKSAYTFTVEGDPSGKAAYRIGDEDNTPWKTLLPDEEGKYVIPGKEIIGNVTIEYI